MKASIKGAMELSQTLDYDRTFLRDNEGTLEEHNKDQLSLEEAQTSLQMELY